VTAPAAGGRRRLAGGVLTVGAGLTVAGAATFITMALTARSLGPTDYAAFAVWWTMATLVGTSFGVFEAYLARLVVTEVAARRTVGPVTGVMTGWTLVAVSGLATMLLVAAPWLGSALFAGSLGAAFLLPAFIVLAAAQALQRGSATGHSRFRAIAGQLSTDGVTRVGLVAGLVVTGHDSVNTLALACCLSAAVSLAVGNRLCPEWLARPIVRGSGISYQPLLFLLIGSAGPLLANNGSVPWLAATGAVGAYTLGAFAGAITLSRLPTQFVSAAFSPLLAQLAHCVEVGDEVTFRHLRRTADTAAWALGVLFVAAFAIAGPWVLSIYLGPGYELEVGTLATLAAASGVMFVAVVQQAALAALDRWRTIAVSWSCGTAAFVLVLLLPVDELLRATVAPLAAVTTALVVMTASRGSHFPRC
jgi:O-antigen/teichoic acid export membrane protein